MGKFKVGDRVRYVALDDCATRPNGMIGTVTGAGVVPRVLWEDSIEKIHTPSYIEKIESPKTYGDIYDRGVIDAHYAKLAIEPMNYSMANGLDPMQHTIIKYVTRFRDKHGIRDLHAAKRVLDMLIEHEESNDGR